MNWKFLLSTSLALSIIFVILMTVVLYIKFKTDSKKSKNEDDTDPNEGRFFKKFHPRKQSPVSNQKHLLEQSRDRTLQKIIFYLPFVVLVLLSAYLWIFHQNLFHNRIQLTGSEISNLKVEPRQWRREISPQRPKLSEILTELRGRRVHLIVGKESLNFKVPGVGRRISSEALASWEIWLEKNEIKYEICTKSNIHTCLKDLKAFYVILPNFWKTEELDILLSSDYRFILSGPPLQIYLDTESWSWKDLSFRKSNEPEKGLIALQSDRTLTLGWAPGALLSINRFFSGVHIKSQNSEALRLTDSLNFSEPPETSISLITAGRRAKGVWMDFLPTEKESERPQLTDDLLAGVFRYLLDKEYSAIASWPEGKKLPVTVTINLDEFSSSLSDLKSSDLKITLFGYSTVMEDARSSLHFVDGLGNVHCQADQERNFDREPILEQVKSIALCVKTIDQILDNNTASGLQPPSERYNDETISAASHLGLDFLLVQHLKQFAPQSFRDVKSSYSINLIPRMFSDDHFLFEKNRFSSADVQRLVHNEIQLARELGAAYIYRTDAHRLNNTDNQKILNIIKKASEDSEVWKTNLSTLSRWWRLRSNLGSGLTLGEEEFKEFRPHILKVNTLGELEKFKMKSNESWKFKGEEDDD